MSPASRSSRARAQLTLKEPPASVGAKPGGTIARLNLQFNPSTLQLNKTTEWRRFSFRMAGESALPEFVGSGVREGGILEQVVHSIEIEVPLDVIPDKLHISVKNLQIGDHLTAKDIIDLPEGATVNLDEDEMIVHCIMPAAEEEEVAGEEGATAEPEVIGKGKEDEEEEAEDKE